MTSDFGPPGLETPTSPWGRRKVIAIGVALAFLVGTYQCRKHFGSYDLMTGHRTCGDAPDAVATWSRNTPTRRPDERVNLERWIARNPGAINSWYGVWCRTPLHAAAQFGREDLAEVLLDGGSDVNAADRSKDQPLHLAAVYGKPGVVRLLLKRGADIEARGSGGKTPLHAAAFGLLGTLDVPGRAEVVRLLISAGASADARTPDGRTPRELAASQPEIAAIFSR